MPLLYFAIHIKYLDKCCHLSY